MASLSPGGHSLDRWQPILVEGRLWGTIVVSSRKELLPPDTEERLERFTDLIATAIANAETSQARAQLGEEQEALRRVATLVAEGVDAQDVFDAVCRETCRLCDATTTSLSRFTPDGINLTMAGWSMHDTHLPVGMRLPIEPDTVADAIVRTHTPARVDSWAGRSGELAKLLRERGVRSSLGAPIVVDGQLWGALIAGSHRVELLPPATEFRLARFTELVATAISNTATRSELIASRASSRLETRRASASSATCTTGRSSGSSPSGWTSSAYARSSPKTSTMHTSGSNAQDRTSTRCSMTSASSHGDYVRRCSPAEASARH